MAQPITCCLLLTAAFAVRATAQSHLFTHVGPQVGAGFGYAVAGAGDVDRDGHADVVVGAFNEAPGGTASVYSGRTGKVLFRVQGDASGDRCGWSVAGIGDVNADGHPDIAVGMLRSAGAGRVRIYSGKTGLVLRTLDGSSSLDGFGHAIAGLGDLDRDGTPDLIVGAVSDSSQGSGKGSAWVHSGATGVRIHVVRGDSAGDLFGAAVRGCGDANRDGVDDFVVGAHMNGKGSGYARVFSGKDAAVLWTLRGASAGDWFGYSVDGGADVDRDGYPEIVVGAWGDDDNGAECGSARIVSLKDGATLRTRFGDQAGAQLGVAVRFIRDVNSDALPDLILGANRVASRKNGTAIVVSGRDASTLFTLAGRSALDNFGLSAADAGDIDADGVPDVIVGAMSDGPGGAAFVHSGRRLALTADEHCIRLARGGTSRLSLDAGAAHARGLYVVVGSWSGTSPGVRLGSWILPLNYDDYMLFTVSFPNSLIMNSVAFLDASGRATAVFGVPANVPVPGELLLHHAYVVLGNLTGPPTFDFTSNARPLSLIR